MARQERHGGGWRPAPPGNLAPLQPVEYRGTILNTVQGQGALGPGAAQSLQQGDVQNSSAAHLPEMVAGEASSGSRSGPQRNRLRKERKDASDTRVDTQSVGSSGRATSPTSISSQYAPSDLSQASSSTLPNSNLPGPYQQHFQHPRPLQVPQQYQQSNEGQYWQSNSSGYSQSQSPQSQTSPQHQRFHQPPQQSGQPEQYQQPQPVQVARYPQEAERFFQVPTAQNVQNGQQAERYMHQHPPPPQRPQLQRDRQYQTSGEYQNLQPISQFQRPTQFRQQGPAPAEQYQHDRLTQAFPLSVPDSPSIQDEQPPLPEQLEVGRSEDNRQPDPTPVEQFQEYVYQDSGEYQHLDRIQEAQPLSHQVQVSPSANHTSATSAYPGDSLGAPVVSDEIEPAVDFSSFLPPEPRQQQEYQPNQVVPISPQSAATSPTIVQCSSPRDAVQQDPIELQAYPPPPQIPGPAVAGSMLTRSLHAPQLPVIPGRQAPASMTKPAANSMTRVQHAPQLTRQATASSMKPPAESIIPLKAWGYWSETTWRWYFTHHFREPNCAYQARMPPLRHRDGMGRVVEKPMEDRYIHPLDGKLRRLIVQSTDQVFDMQGLVTWRRTYVRKVSPLGARLATWVTDYRTSQADTWDDFWVQVSRTLPAAFAMMFFLWSFQTQPDVLSLSYDAVHCKYLGDAKVWSNLLENGQGPVVPTRDTSNYTLLRPRYLCLLTEDDNPGFTVISVEEWYTKNAESGQALEYLFVAYSNEQFPNSSNSHMTSLHNIAKKATRDAGLPAFWVAGSCMPEDVNLEDDIYRIADVVRGAKSMVVAVAPCTGNRTLVPTPADLLQQWGSRIWTFPELLLCPVDTISIYSLENDQPVTLHALAKQQMGKMIWQDAQVSQQLMDHYQGTISLSRLELAILALKCLYARKTTQWFAGDQSYALMGLLRLRPHIDRTDSAFQAFARISLSNDSDRLLERYVCLLPKTLEQPWHCMDDQYESSPWDIEPACQVAGVCHDDTIVLDGAHGACIRWKSFKPVWATTGPSFKRMCAQKLMEMSFVFFIIGVALLGFAGGLESQMRSLGGSGGTSVSAPYIVPGVLFLLMWIAVILLTPKLVRIVYGGKFHNVQACLFGIEGYLNPPTIERAIFGGAFGRLKWSAAGSPLSLSYVNEHGEKVGIDPCRDANTAEKIETSKSSKPGDVRIFTLVDTYSMEVTLFEAVRPPTALFICGNEGGMQRAVACSYDWRGQTFERETVLRLPTETLNRLHRVPRFRMGIVRRPYPAWVPVATVMGNGSRV